MNVGIFVFDEVEVLDFAAPFEVFSVTGWQTGTPPFAVFTVAETLRSITARNGLSVNPGYAMSSHPPIDLLVLPGGFGTRREIHNAEVIAWISDVANTARVTLSICTGALLLAKAGLLDGLSATTHEMGFELLKQLAPAVDIRRGIRYVDNGKIVCSAGISAGIDASLHVVARLQGAAIAMQTAQYMEYEWKPPEL